MITIDRWNLKEYCREFVGHHLVASSTVVLVPSPPPPKEKNESTITTTTMAATYNSAKYMRQGQNIPGRHDPLIRFNPYTIPAFDPDQ